MHKRSLRAVSALAYSIVSSCLLFAGCGSPDAPSDKLSERRAALCDPSSCDDGDICTEELCDSEGACVHRPVNVTDGNPCTVDSCDPAVGVVHTPAAAGASCADSNPCDGAEVCDGSGSCVSGVAPSFDDGNPCTADSCDPVQGVIHTSVAAGTTCSDGDGCNGVETCNGAGTCRPGLRPGIDDGNPCTVDSCDAVNGIIHSPLADCVYPPPDPATIAPPLDPRVATSVYSATRFLYEGSPRIQIGVAPGTISPRRASLVRGKVRGLDGVGLGGVTVRVLDHPELGATATRTDGKFDLAVNGGGPLTLVYSKPGFLPVERTVVVDWQQWRAAPDVVMTPIDVAVTPITFGSGSMQVAQSTTVSDANGARQVTMLFPPGVEATAHLSDGSTAPLLVGNVRATEFTRGARGPKAMPGNLPCTSAYTYAADISFDEALAAGVASVQFSQPIITYVPNFLGLSAGSDVPVGSFDGQRSAWAGGPNGRVVTVVGIVDGVAQLDLGHDGQAETDAELEAFGISLAERQEVASRFSVGATLLRSPLPHLTPVDFNVIAGGCSGDCPAPGDPLSSGSGSGSEGTGSGGSSSGGSSSGGEGTGGDTGSGGGSGSGSGGSGGSEGDGEGDGEDGDGTSGEGSSGTGTGTGTGTGSADGGGVGHPELPDPCGVPGNSIILCENQALGESLPVTGTPLQLVYNSTRVPGRTIDTSLDLRLTGASLPSALQKVKLTVEVAGRRFVYNYAPTLNLRRHFVWDGKDAYGRTMQGGVEATVTVSYEYPLGIYEVSDADSYVFPVTVGEAGGNSQLRVDLDREGRVFRRERVSKVSLGAWRNLPSDLGGWGLSVVHAYDVTSKTLYLGDGRIRSAQHVGDTVSAVIGGGTVSPISAAVGQPATSLWEAGESFAVAPDGSIFFTSGTYNDLYKVDPQGILHVLNGSRCNWLDTARGNGGPIGEACVEGVGGMAMHPDGSLYFGDGRTLRRLGPDGIVTHVAGALAPSGGCLSTGDGGPAVSATFQSITHVAIGLDGSVYVIDSGAVRRIGANGIVTTVAGNACQTWQYGPVGDNVPATETLFNPQDITVGPRGDLFIADPFVIRRVGCDGIVHTVAGTGDMGNTGDGGPALLAHMGMLSSLAVAPDESIYLLSLGFNFGIAKLRKIGPDGIIRAVAGTDDQSALSGDGGPLGRARFISPTMVRLGPMGQLYVADHRLAQGQYGGWWTPSTIRRVANPLPEFSSNSLVIPSEDGREVHEFSAEGRHLRTIDTRTKAVLWQLGYTADGLLSTLTDVDGNVTTVTRDGQGRPTGLVSPYGQLTSLTVDANGYLSSVTNPANETVGLQHTASGLLVLQHDRRNFDHIYTYDAQGFLKKDEDAAGGFISLSTTGTYQSWATTLTTALGHSTIYAVERQADGSLHRTVTAPDGTTTTTVRGIDGSKTTIAPDGTVTHREYGPDPRFGMAAPVLTRTTTTLPSGLSRVETANRTAELSDFTDPLSLVKLTETRSLSGSGGASSSEYHADTRTTLDTSAEGRLSTTVLDAKGRVSSYTPPGLPTQSFSYDPKGRLTSIVEAATASDPARTTSFGYVTTSPFLQSVTNTLLQTTSFEQDAIGRVTRETRPDGAYTLLGYDSGDNLTSLTPPGRPAHHMSYSPVNLLASYEPPPVSGSGTTSTLYTQDVDRLERTESRPDGTVITTTPDAAGRVGSVSYGNETVTYGYHPQTGQLTSLTGPGAQSLSFGYDGALQTSTTWSGTVNGSVSYEYDAAFRVSKEKVNGAYEVVYQYDADGLVTDVGPLHFVRSPTTGRVESATVGNLSETWGYNLRGELTGHEVKFGSATLYSVTYGRDELGRIHTRSETIEGVTRSWEYGYDLQGRLTDAIRNPGPNQQVGHYDYDGNGNRIAATAPWAPESEVALGQAVYDDQDRLLQYGATTFTYGANGEVATRTDASGTTTYTYDAMGNLLSVTLPGGDVVSYTVDGKNRRIVRKVGSSVTQQWVYNDQTRIVAEFDGGGALPSRFVYAPGSHSPDLIERGGVIYRLVKDQIGTIVQVMDTSAGTVVQRLDAGPWGELLTLTSLGWQPLGFAGGLADYPIGLIRFGERDYSPQYGRWFSRDRIRFDGGSFNLYAYVNQHPIDMFDPSGRSGSKSPPQPVPDKPKDWSECGWYKYREECEECCGWECRGKPDPYNCEENCKAAQACRDKPPKPPRSPTCD